MCTASLVVILVRCTIVMVAAGKGLFKAIAPIKLPSLNGAEADRSSPGDTMSVDPMQKFGKENMDMAMNAFGAWAKMRKPSQPR